MGYFEMSYTFLEIKMAAAQKPALVFFVCHVCSYKWISIFIVGFC